MRESVRLAYERIARQYAGDEPAEDDPSMRKQCRDVFQQRLKGKDILEIGCGPGTDAKQFHDFGLRVMATDIAEEFVSIVKERYPSICAETMDMTDPHFAAGSFDGIYSFASFIHVPREQAPETLRKLGRILRPGGVMFLALIKSNKVSEYTIPNWGGLENNQLRFVCHAESEIKGHLLTAGFERIEFFSFSSPIYEKMPRLVEREVKCYQVMGQRPI